MPQSTPDQPTNDLITSRYNYAEADRLVQVSRGTTKRWLEGYKYRRDGEPRTSAPVSTAADFHVLGEGASFVDLIEVKAIEGLREVGFTTKNIRQVVSDCEEIFQTRHPLASHAFETDGREIYVKHNGVLVGLLGRKWEVAWREFLYPFLQTLDYRDDLASRWYPLGREVPVIIDPQYGFGLPVIEGTGIRTEIVAELFEHELEEEIAEDLGITVLQVKRALQFEISRREIAA